MNLEEIKQLVLTKAGNTEDYSLGTKPTITKVGGQALYNGILMIGKRAVSVIRKDDGSIAEQIRELSPSTFNVPFLRGFFVLSKQLLLGLKTMMYSAKSSKPSFSKVFPFLLLFSLIFCPSFSDIPSFPVLQQYGDLIFVILLLFILRMTPSVRKMLKYHGAEHKTIHCYEASVDLSIENVRKFPKEHPRCGTSFVLIILALEFLFGVLIFLTDLIVSENASLIILLIIFSLAFEIQLFINKRQDNKFFRLLTYPGIWLQKLTTIEPTAAQIEVAILALKKAVE